MIPEPQPTDVPRDTPDVRLYLHTDEHWNAHVKRGWEKLYCFRKLPTQDYFHLILSGEIYLQRGEADEVLCLRCALQEGLLTHERLSWQRRPSSLAVRPAGPDDGPIIRLQQSPPETTPE